MTFSHTRINPNSLSWLIKYYLRSGSLLLLRWHFLPLSSFLTLAILVIFIFFECGMILLVPKFLYLLFPLPVMLFVRASHDSVHSITHAVSSNDTSAKPFLILAKTVLILTYWLLPTQLYFPHSTDNYLKLYYVSICLFINCLPC